MTVKSKEFHLAIACLEKLSLDELLELKHSAEIEAWLNPKLASTMGMTAATYKQLCKLRDKYQKNYHKSKQIHFPTLFKNSYNIKL